MSSGEISWLSLHRLPIFCRPSRLGCSKLPCSPFCSNEAVHFLNRVEAIQSDFAIRVLHVAD
jgi:hypothetical protein